MTAVQNTISRLLGQRIFQAVVVAGLALSVLFLANGTLQILCFVMIGIIFAQSINLLTGIAGQISLGHAGFFGIGAYGSALLAKNFGIELYAAIPLATLMAAVAAWLLSFPARRVRDVYLAMMTLGFGMIFFEIIREWTDLTGGMMGLSGVPSANLKTLKVLGHTIDIRGYFLLILAATAFFLYVMSNITRSRIGRSFYAIHYSEVAAGSLGISRGATKQLAYSISGAAAGLAGAFYAHLVGYLGPDSFALHRSIEVLVISIVGGLGSIAGQVIGATVFTFLPEKLQFFAEYQFIVYGLILTFSLVLLPKGIAGLVLANPRYIRSGSLLRAQQLPPVMPENVSAKDNSRPILEVVDVTMRFGGLTALSNVSITLSAGKITALVGPNGSGKSTMVNVVSGLYRPADGTVKFNGEVIAGLLDHQVAERGLIRTFQDPRLVPNFTVRENLMLGAHRMMKTSGLSAALATRAATEEEAHILARVDQILALIGLTDVADEQIDGLPYGYRRLADVGRALLADPVAILLDEPAAGLAEPEMERLSKLIKDMKSLGIAILLIDHHMDFLAELVDEVVVLDSGKLIYRGSMQGMRDDSRVIAAYLGQEDVVHA